MADVRLTIASREYIVTCRDGEEDRLLSLGALVDDMAREAGGSAGGLNESRQLLFAALLLADKLYDLRSKPPPEISDQAANTALSDQETARKMTDQAAAAIETLAERLEALANKLEN